MRAMPHLHSKVDVRSTQTSSLSFSCIVGAVYLRSSESLSVWSLDAPFIWNWIIDYCLYLVSNATQNTCTVRLGGQLNLSRLIVKLS
jgi:hypothetical protein